MSERHESAIILHPPEFIFGPRTSQSLIGAAVSATIFPLKRIPIYLSNLLEFGRDSVDGGCKKYEIIEFEILSFFLWSG